MRTSVDRPQYTLSLQHGMVKPMEKSSLSGFWLIEVGYDLRILKGHWKIIEEQVDRGYPSAEEILDTMLENRTSISQDEHRHLSNLADVIHDEHFKVRLPRILYNPFLVSLYTVYESAVTRIASLIQEEKGQSSSLGAVKKGDFLDRAKKYYQHVLNFELSNNNQSWERLKILADLRHAIAHANGHLEMVTERKKKKIEQWIENDIGIEEYDRDIVVSRFFVKETFELVKATLDDLGARYNELKGASIVPQETDRV